MYLSHVIPDVAYLYCLRTLNLPQPIGLLYTLQYLCNIFIQMLLQIQYEAATSSEQYRKGTRHILDVITRLNMCILKCRRRRRDQRGRYPNYAAVPERYASK
jgi:hypothetical protein